MDHVFGEAYSRTLARELALDALDSRTSTQSLSDGIDPRDVWHAICKQMEVPIDRRDGGDRERIIPRPR
jgi:hypothetical protein